MTFPTTNAIPEAAYEALRGLKAQAEAAMQMFPTNDKQTRQQGKKALAQAHAIIAANEPWGIQIMGLLKLDGKSLSDVDASWLERSFS